MSGGYFLKGDSDKFEHTWRREAKMVEEHKTKRDLWNVFSGEEKVPRSAWKLFPQRGNSLVSQCRGLDRLQFKSWSLPLCGMDRAPSISESFGHNWHIGNAS